jgi:HD-GYP domain-containing protein (c-di-GMP phosphodiesterase class II)
MAKKSGGKQKKGFLPDKAAMDELLKISENIHNISDIDILLDKILFELRKFTNAESGTIFLMEEDELKIKYIQNDLLFKNNPSAKYTYLDRSVAVNEDSIAGSAAAGGKIIMINDAYHLSKECHCGFNRAFDKKTGYRTKSVLAFPLKSLRNRVTGVIQLINARDAKGKIIPFTERDELYVTYFGNDAAVAIEKAKTTRSMILRMLKMVEYRDPKETGGHVNRMGAYAVEIYHEWAKQRGFPEELIRRFKDKLRIAAMLHDAGKIGISDGILKKPGKLDDDEFRIMKLHTVFGYRLFADSESELDAMASEIALSHHERWDGSGYPGKLGDLMGIKSLDSQPGKTGTEIPITGRIVTVADVYDALISKRIYKDAWSEDRVLEYIKENSGKQFDPEVVDSFFAIYDTIKAIRDKFVETQAQED